MASRHSPVANRAVILPQWGDRLPSTWTWHRLSEVCEDVVDCPHSTPEIVDHSSYLMARTPDILTGKFRSDQARRVSKATYEERVRRAEPQSGDLLYSREGTYFGFAAVVPPNIKVCLGQRMVLLRLNASAADSTYVRFWLNSPRIQEYIHGHRDGSVAERLNLPTIRSLPVCLPPGHEQRAIAHILGTLDDKIELNRRMNQTLEQMAAAIFKAWFVDFEPVKAKADGAKSFPSMPQEVFDALPTEFTDSPLGPIPKGWRIRTVEDVTHRVTKGDTPRKEALKAAPEDDQMIPMLRVNAITEDGEILMEKLEFIPYSIHIGKSSRSILQANDILYTNAGTIGRVSLVQKDLLPANTNQAIAIVRPDPVQVLPAYLFMMLRQPEFQTELHCDIVQAVQANLALGKISAASGVFPPRGHIGRLFSAVTNILHLIFYNRRESRTLAEIRDALLPKLLSGEIRLGEVECIAEGVA